MKPNLFTYATSELSNDAMICWILEWGNYKEEKLYNLSKEFIGLMIQKDIQVNDVKIHKQYKHIDILIEVNDKYIIAIEDKIDTKEHSNQLNRYKKILKEDFSQDYDQNKFNLIYLTIGDEACYQDVCDKGYKVINRKDILNLIVNYRDESDILEDYYNYLNEMELKFNLYKTEKEISKWSYRTWTGFYSYLKESVIKGDSNWDYVNNPRGGFCAFVWDVHEFVYNKDIEYYIYLQIEENRIAFKVQVDNKKYQSEIRNYAWSKLNDVLNNNKDYSNKINKTIFRQGNWMTIAEISELENKEDILLSMQIAEKVNESLKKSIKEESL